MKESFNPYKANPGQVKEDKPSAPVKVAPKANQEPAARVFFGLRLYDSARRFLIAQRECIECDGKITRDENLHITMRFIGMAEPEQIERLKRALEKTAMACHPFAATISGLGSFHEGEIVWAGVQSDYIQTLYEKLDTAIEAQGWPRDGKRFTPHITLFRDAKKVLLPKTTLSHTAAFDSIALMQSVRVNGILQYVPIAESKLTGGVDK